MLFTDIEAHTECIKTEYIKMISEQRKSMVVKKKKKKERFSYLTKAEAQGVHQCFRQSLAHTAHKQYRGETESKGVCAREFL